MYKNLGYVSSLGLHPASNFYRSYTAPPMPTY